MKVHFYVVIGFVFFSTSQSNSIPVKALTIVPIADLVGDSFYATSQTKEVFNYYNNLPLCGQRPFDCPRVHQLLFNESVTLLEQKNDEVLVQIPTVFFEVEQNNKRYNTYWSLRKNFITQNELRDLGISLDCFPAPIDYKSTTNPLSKKKVIALISPFKDLKTNQFFSVGTRFVVNKKLRNAYSVYIFDSNKKHFLTSSIPVHSCRIDDKFETMELKTQNFVTVLRSWTKSSNFIPYVWGGCSFTSGCLNNRFELIEKNIAGKNCAYYARQECNKSPKNGFDCTGLVVRAAQICGLPYYFKNSTTVLKHLQPARENQKIVEGDIIWLPGHIMVAADIKKNTIIEARAYNHGFGKVHEILLSKVFQGITTFEQLQKAYKNKLSLQRLDNQGKVAQVIDRFELLKMDSIWSQKL